MKKVPRFKYWAETPWSNLEKGTGPKILNGRFPARFDPTALGPNLSGRWRV